MLPLAAGRSVRRAVVVSQQAAQTFAAANLPFSLADRPFRLQELVAHPLMVPFRVVMDT